MLPFAITVTYLTATGFRIPSFPRKRESRNVWIPVTPTLGLDARLLSGLTALGYEVAARLSVLLWGTIPDDTLNT